MKQMLYSSRQKQVFIGCVIPVTSQVVWTVYGGGPNVSHLKLATVKISAPSMSYKHAMGKSSTKTCKRDTCGFYITPIWYN